MDIDAGDLIHRIAIYARTRVQDADGYYTESERLVRRCWAKFSRMSGTEISRANADYTEIKVRFLIRAASVPIDRKMLVRYGGDDYDIVYVNDYANRHEFVELVAVRRTQEAT